MNDLLSDLGEFLASAFQDKMAQWSSLESISTGDDLSASSALADDVLRFEEGWQALTALSQISQTDFVPQDLFTVANDTALRRNNRLSLRVL